MRDWGTIFFKDLYHLFLLLSVIISLIFIYVHIYGAIHVYLYVNVAISIMAINSTIYLKWTNVVKNTTYQNWPKCNINRFLVLYLSKDWIHFRCRYLKQKPGTPILHNFQKERKKKYFPTDFIKKKNIVSLLDAGWAFEKKSTTKTLSKLGIEKSFLRKR